MKHISVFTLAALLTIWAGLVMAGGYHHHKIINNYDIDNTYVNNFTKNYNANIAQLMAGDAIHCTTSTRKHQMGIGAGYNNGKNGYAVGGCQTFITDGGIPVMLGIKAAVANDAKPLYSLGLNFTF